MMTKRGSIKKPKPRTIARRGARMVQKAARATSDDLDTARAMPGIATAEQHAIDGSILTSLQRERQRLLEEIARQELLVQDRPTSMTHLADVASEVAEQLTDHALRHHLETLLEAIEKATVRVKRGTYGKCERCGERIDPERLRIVPSAALCIACAQRQARSLKATLQRPGDEGTLST